MHLKAGQRVEAEHGAEAFEVLDVLGEGRTGEVYAVQSVRTRGGRSEFERRMAAMTGEMAEAYAVKLARGSSGEALTDCNTRILRELAARERLVHPGIAHAAAVGWHQGRAFFVMEQLQGPNLAQHLSGRTPQSYLERMELFLQLSEAMEQCHALGVIHRDLRPSNIIVESGRGPVLLGFEWCTLSPGEEAQSLGVGAAEYAPPDVLAQLLDPAAIYVVHPRADVYAMGGILYLLLTGRPLVERGSKDLTEYLRALRDAKPASPVAVNPEAPPACAALAMLLLGKDGPVDAQSVPELVREALAEDGAALSLRACPYQAGAETLLSSIRVPPRRAVGTRRVLPELWAAGSGLLRRNVAQLAVAAVLVAGGAVVRGNEHAAMSRMLAESNQHESETNAALSHAMERLTVLLTEGPIRPSAVPLTGLSAGGLKVPDKPDPTWLRPGADGKCRNPWTGERLPGVGVVRGTCWSVGAKMDPKQLCPETWYDVPPDAASNPNLQDSCLKPVVIQPKPQAVTPDPP